MMTSNSQQEFKTLLQEFTAAKEAEYSYAFTTGYLESLAVAMFGAMSRKQQKVFAQQIQDSVDSIRV